jgi:hypothetical protein
MIPASHHGHRTHPWTRGQAQGGHVNGAAAARRGKAALCPLRPGHPCTLCHPEAKVGPQDCPTVAIVMDDPELRAEAVRLRAEAARARA